MRTYIYVIFSTLTRSESLEYKSSPASGRRIGFVAELGAFWQESLVR